MYRRLTTLPPIAAIAAAGLVLAACGGDDAAEETSSPAESSAPAASSPPSDETAAGPLGPGCADLEDSLATLSTEPLTTAVTSVPELSTLASALSGGLNPDVDLIDTLSAGDVTVFAPVDDAFAAIDPATLDTLSTDAEALTSILTYHVVPGQLAPEEIAGTTQTTLEGSDVVVEGEPDALTVNEAGVICGGIAVADAQVYLIDAVLDPATAPVAEETATAEESATS